MATKPPKVLPHGEPEPVCPELWSVTGSLPFPLRRNMVVYRLASGNLLLHSVIAMTDDGMARLDALGKPTIIVVPNGGHRMDVAFYKGRYPGARVVCPAAARAKVEEVVAVDAAAEEALPALGVRPHALTGFKNGELAYELDVAGGKALVMGDAVANRDYAPGLFGSFLANVTGGVKGRLGVARIVKMTLINSKAAARQDLARLAEIAALKAVVPAHGRPVVERCGEALREAAASI
ncbi:MAG: hypothetical protein ABJA82_02680 [Myxococcales bacterium]